MNDERRRQSRDATVKTTFAKGGAVPTIESVLEAHESRAKPDDNSLEESSPTAFTPHIPHPTSIGPSADASNGGEQSQIRAGGRSR